MKMTKWLTTSLISLSISAVAVTANAAMLRFTFYDQTDTAFESFLLDSGAGQPNAFTNYIYFNITGSTSGANAAYFGNNVVNGNLGFGQFNSLNDPCCGSVIPAYDNHTFPAAGIYSGSGVALAAAVVPGYSVNLFSRGDELRVTAVPEPAAWALMIMGFGAAGSALRSRRRRATA